MLDLNFIRDNLAEVKENIVKRGIKASPEIVLDLANRKRQIVQELESQRSARNKNALQMQELLEDSVRRALIEKGRNLKESITALEHELELIERNLKTELMRIPNMADPKAPIGKEDKDNLEIKCVGEPPRFHFDPLDHVRLGEKLDIIDFESGTRVSGPKFYFLKNEGVFLELALVRYAIDILVQKGFTAFITPDIAKEDILLGIGFQPRGEESNIYPIEGTGTCLIGTAEITLGGYYSDQIIDLKNGPLRMAGISHCFRREAGTYGQFSRGLYRVHQFTKVEMFVYCKPQESEAMHQELLGIEEEIFSSLGIPFRVVEVCTGDLGAPAYKKYDLEAWMPGRGGKGGWGEITSTSNCTDYQARRLGIRYKDEFNKSQIVHMLNGTAMAVSRTLIAILENFQQEDGSVRLPSALVPYAGFEVIRPK